MSYYGTGERQIARKRAICITVLVLFLGSVGLLPLPVRAQHDTLASKSKRIASNIQDMAIWGASYQWLTDNELMVWWFESPEPGHSSNIVIGASKLDLTSGKLTPLTNLNQTISQIMHDDGNPPLIFTLGLSPDRKQLLWCDRVMTIGGYKFYNLSLEGVKLDSGYLDPDANLFSTKWHTSNSIDILQTGDFGAYIDRRRIKTATYSNVKIDVWDYAIHPNRKQEEYRDRQNSGIIGYTAEGRCTVWNSNANSEGDVALYDVDAEPGSNEPHKYLIHLPHKGTVAEIVLSGDGKRLAWCVEVPDKSQPKNQQLLGHYIRELWMSDIHGKGMRLIGRQSVIKTDGAIPSGPRDVQWTLDNQHVSYWYDSSVWVVPAVWNR